MARLLVWEMWLQMSKKIAYGLLVTGLILIFAGLILQIHKDNQIIKDKDILIKEKDERIDTLAKEINKLRAENEALWDNYYMNVTNYEGYEYYE